MCSKNKTQPIFPFESVIEIIPDTSPMFRMAAKLSLKPKDEHWDYLIYRNAVDEPVGGPFPPGGLLLLQSYMKMLWNFEML